MLLDKEDVKRRIEGHPEDANAYLRGLLADGYTIGGIAATLGITPQRMSQKARNIGVDGRDPDYVYPHKRCPVCGKRYWRPKNKTCGDKRCTALNRVDMEAMCDTMESIANYKSWRQVCGDIFNVDGDDNAWNVKVRVCKWLDLLGYSRESAMLYAIDNRQRDVAMNDEEREAIRELTTKLRGNPVEV